MANFPETVKPMIPYRWQETNPTVWATMYPNGTRRARLGGYRTFYSCTLRYAPKALSAFNDILDFVKARRGTYESFTFTDFHGWDASPVGAPVRRRYVGIATGGAQTLDLPLKSSSSVSIYEGDTLKTLTTDYTLSSGTGTDGRDQVVLVNGQFTAGGLVTVTAVGRLCINAVFANPTFEFENPFEMLVRTGLAIEEVA